ncbi:MAG: hypothetical protein RR766_03305 [Longicatena sp.]|jgi:heat shock protein HslJ|uniref:hypothetical protein n=1 Tax=Anaerorhabdus sp. TaxID=1872524 RepID=UPI002FCA2D1B
MKKIFIAFLVLILVGVTGCSTKPKESTSTPTPAPTATPNEETKAPEEGPKESATPTPEETAQTDSLSVTDTTIAGKFVENTENSPTTIIFNEDGTFSANVNACTGMIDITGTYLKEGERISLTIPDETGIYYIDHDQPFFFDFKDDVLKDKYDGGLSCADVGVYSVK